MPCAKYYWNNKIKEDEMGRAGNMLGREGGWGVKGFS
jgi:hypothetical protein